MPGFVKTAADEKKWKRAKAIASKQKKRKGSNQYALANHIFQGMGKSEATPVGLGELLACLRHAYELAHSFHWRTSGTNFAADHELFAKVYTSLYGFLDPLAEKIVGMGGEAEVEAAKQAKATAAEHGAAVNEPGKFPEEMLTVVNKVLAEITEAVKSNDDDGLENFLQGMADSIQTLKYMLQQRSSSPAQKSERLILDLHKSRDLLAANGEAREQRWQRFPGAASMFNARDAEARETQRLMTTMPTPKLAISDGNFTSPNDVVKGLGFAPTDETLWAHRVARMVARAPSELSLRKAVAADLRSESLDPSLRLEMGRRILSLYRQRAGGKPLEKAFVTKDQFKAAAKGKPPFPPKKPAGPTGGIGKPDNDQPAPGKAPPFGAQQKPAQAAPDGNKPPAVDSAELQEQPDDQQLLRNKIHALHEELKACQGPITGNAALIHMHNDLKAQMRDAYQDPTPEVVADIDHKIHHFTKMLEGPTPPEPPPEDPSSLQPQPGQPGPGGGRQPGKRPPQQPPMMKSVLGRGERMKPKGQHVIAGAKRSPAKAGLKAKKPKGAVVNASGDKSAKVTGAAQRYGH